MKVEEAKQKICPFMSNCIATEDSGIGLYEVKCKANECMAWVTTKTTHNMLTERVVIDNGNGTSSVKNVPMQLKDNDQEGFCKRIGQ